MARPSRDYYVVNGTLEGPFTADEASEEVAQLLDADPVKLPDVIKGKLVRVRADEHVTYEVKLG